MTREEWNVSKDRRPRIVVVRAGPEQETCADPACNQAMHAKAWDEFYERMGRALSSGKGGE